MSIDLSKATALCDDYGNIVQLELGGKVIWAVSGGKVILLVEKITSDTYAGETTYTGEQFILLDIYPKTNGTVKVTYGGLTKTITDTSGAEEPNAQQVFFGTFNGVSDSVATPASGELTIEGDYYGFGIGSYDASDKDVVKPYAGCITAVTSFGEVRKIVDNAFGPTLTNDSNACLKLTSIEIPDKVSAIGRQAFYGCNGLTKVTFANTSGWYITETRNGDASTGTAVDVSDPVNNATLLNNSYAYRYWYRS